MIVFDDIQLKRQRTRAANTRGDHDFLVRGVWADMAARVSLIKRGFDTPTTLSARAIDTFLSAQDKIEKRPQLLSYINGELIAGPAQPDLILSNFDLHTVNDLPGLLAQIRRALQPDGVFIAAFPGGETLYELRHALTHAELALSGGVSPRVFPFIDKQQAGALMQRAGFALPVVDSDIIKIEYTSLTRLMHDLRFMGEGNAIAARKKDIPPRSLFAHAEEIYKRDHAVPSGNLIATFEIIHVIGWGPADTQQKPLKPGSAQIRLADALGTNEIGAHDPARPDPEK
jgi:SAM-dependent methyltransferase